MTHVIRIDDEVMKCLDKKAHEFNMVFPSRNDVLRKVLGLPPVKKHSQSGEKTHKTNMAPERTGGKPKGLINSSGKKIKQRGTRPPTIRRQ